MPFVDESKVTEWTNRLKSYFALLTHKHDASDITSGTLTVSQGGTSGTTALDARKNLSVPVDSSIAYVESTTATTNHAAGDYFMLGSVLMKATAAIATGEQITTSKATPVTIQSQIDTLRDSVDLDLSGPLVERCKLITYGKVATLDVSQLVGTLRPREYTTIATIPSGYRPKDAVRYVTDDLGHEGVKVLLNVNTAGQVRYYSYATSDVSDPNVYGLLTWIIA